MSEYNDELQDDMKLESQNRKRFQEKALQDIDKYIILNETQTFNNSKLSDENSIIILVKLIYLVNQGIQFNQEQEEQLFFRITKLFQSNNSELREMTYKSIKMIITNLQIQSTALIVGIHIVNRFPNLVAKWLFEVVQNLDQRKENLQYHALILLHEIKKSKLAQFIKFIILMTKKQSSPLVNLQIIKFIKEILPQTENPQKQELMTYLLRQLQRSDPLNIFESSQILINDQNLANDEFVPINQFMEEHMHTQSDSILSLTSLKFLLNLTYQEKRIQLLVTKQISYLQTLPFHFNIKISSLAILLVIKLEQKNHDLQLKRVYDIKINLDSKKCFLNGLIEIVRFNNSYNQIVLEFIRIADFKLSKQDELVDIAIQIIEATLNHPKQNLKDVHITIIQLTQDRGREFQYIAIKLMNRIFLNIQSYEMDSCEIFVWFKYLQNKNISEMNENQLELVRKQYISLQQFIEKYKMEYEQFSVFQMPQETVF